MICVVCWLAGSFVNMATKVISPKIGSRIFMKFDVDVQRD